MKKLFAFAVVANLLAVFLFAQEARNALLIANGEYKNIPSLSRPVQEGMDLKEALESIGFEVTFIQNATLSEMVAALSEFENKVKNDKGVAFFHYGGHAVQFNKENYLIPVDANTEYNMITYTCINVDEAVMKRMTGETNIVVLDSCRNDPFEEYMTDAEQRGFGTNRGLAAVKLKSKNSIIIYSAQAGHTAQDGIFTPVFTEKITEKGKSLSDVITETSDSVAQLTMNEQVPAVYGRLMSIYLAGETAVSYDLKKTIATGSISVTSEFPGKIYLDGNYQSDISAFETVVLEDVATARYKLEIEGKNTSDNQSKYIVVKKNEESSILFKVVTGSIEITSEIAGEVYINKQNYGKILSGETLSLYNIPAAHYTVEVCGEENEVLSGTVTVAANETVKVSLEQKKALTDEKQAASKKNIFSVKRKKWSKSGEIQLLYSKSFFNLCNEEYFPAYGFEIDLCPISLRKGDPFSFAFECKSVYTFESTSIGNEHFTFHEADILCLSFGFEIMSRFSLLSGVGFATTWQTFENNTTAISYKGTSDPMYCLVVYPVEMKLRLGEYVSLIGKYKFEYAFGHNMWDMRHSLNIGIAINCWYGKEGV
ncbi:MAG: caspase family protein [Treponemataceae bacterium]|nr:caspase family protein [Treponemataceae bacterium]